MESTARSTAQHRPVEFLVPFWGRSYADCFLDFCLASLMAPGNVPALMREGWRCRFLICTTQADIERLRTRPFFNAVAAEVPVEFLEFQGPVRGEGKMQTMSRAHVELSARAHADGALAVYLTPDMIFSANAMGCVARAVREGVRALLVPAIRYSHEAVLERLAAEGIRPGGGVLALEERRLARIGLQSLHTETQRYEYGRPWFATFPISVYWRAGDAMVLYSFSWAPMLLDYGAIQGEHDQTTFEHWTMDGDYVHRNFGHAGDTRIITDSDQLMLVTLTREADVHFELRPRRLMASELARRVAIARCYLHPTMDDLKRRIFPVATLIHAADIDAELAALRDRSGERVCGSISFGLPMILAALLIALDRRTYSPILDRHAPRLAAAYRRVRDAWRRLFAPAAD